MRIEKKNFVFRGRNSIQLGINPAEKPTESSMIDSFIFRPRIFLLSALCQSSEFEFLLPSYQKERSTTRMIGKKLARRNAANPATDFINHANLTNKARNDFCAQRVVTESCNSCDHLGFGSNPELWKQSVRKKTTESSMIDLFNIPDLVIICALWPSLN